MVIVVNGKERKSGTSKKGSQYDFIVLHFLAAQRGVIGKAAIQKILDPSVIAYVDILINQGYEIEVDLSGNIIAMKVAKT